MAVTDEVIQELEMTVDKVFTAVYDDMLHEAISSGLSVEDATTAADATYTEFVHKLEEWNGDTDDAYLLS